MACTSGVAGLWTRYSGKNSLCFFCSLRPANVLGDPEKTGGRRLSPPALGTCRGSWCQVCGVGRENPARKGDSCRRVLAQAPEPAGEPLGTVFRVPLNLGGRTGQPPLPAHIPLLPHDCLRESFVFVPEGSCGNT